MPKKYKNPKKPNIISIRISDDEMETVQQLMDTSSKRASELMREAFTLFRAQWEISAMAASGEHKLTHH